MEADEKIEPNDNSETIHRKINLYYSDGLFLSIRKVYCQRCRAQTGQGATSRLLMPTADISVQATR